MTNAANNFTSPVGRLVGGDIFTANTKGFDGQPLTTRSGEPRVEYIVQVAFPKSDPATEEMRGKIYRAAMEGFPTLFGPDGACIFPTFSFKWQDGDSNIPNMKGNKPCEREGFPGCWVLTFKSSFAPKAFDQSTNPIADQAAIKRGDWVRVGVSCKSNGQPTKPGVYLNHSMIQLCGYGEAISSGPDAAEVFGGAYTLPAGASATPMAPAGGMPGAPPAGVPGGVPAGVPAGVPMPGAVPPSQAPPTAAPGVQPPLPGMPAPGVPGAAPAPVAGFGAAPAAPPPGAAAPVAPAPPLVKATVPGCPHTYQALVTAGWTEDKMRSAGFLA